MAVAASFLRGPAIATTFRHCHGFSLLPPNPFFSAPYSRLAFFTSSSSSCVASTTPALSLPELEQTQVLVQGRELAVVQPRDVDKVLDMYINQGRLDGDPYWCRVWPSALVLGEEMLRNSQLVANLRVCDLGSGLGRLGWDFCIGSWSKRVHTNFPHVTTNLPVLLQRIFGDSIRECIESLAYGLALSPEIFERESIKQGATSTARAEVFDWSETGMNTLSFDMVLACDVLYEKTSVPHIAAILPHLVRSGSGKVIMTDPTHRTPQHRKEFLSLLGSNPSCKGLKLERMEKVQVKSNDKMEDVELMHFCST